VAFDVDSQQFEAVVKLQARTRGVQARKQLSDFNQSAEAAAEAAPAVETKVEQPPKKMFGLFGKPKKEELAWEDTYVVTLTRGPDTFKGEGADKVVVKASLGMKIVQFSEDSPPVISEIYPGQPAANAGVMRKGDTILTVNGIDMSDPTKGISALADASTVEIKGKRGTEEIAAAAAKLQATFRGNAVRKAAGAPIPEPKPMSWFACCASPRKPKKL